MDLRELLNGYKWGRSGRLEDLELEILHRGVPGDSRWLRGSDIVAVEARGIVVAEAGSPEGGGTSVIPFHRVLAVVEKGRTLWRREPPGTGATA